MTANELKNELRDRGLSTKGKKSELLFRIQTNSTSLQLITDVQKPPIEIINEVKEPPSPSLIVCPLSVLSAWMDQLEAHIKNDIIKVLVYHGVGR